MTTKQIAPNANSAAKRAADKETLDYMTAKGISAWQAAHEPAIQNELGAIWNEAYREAKAAWEFDREAN